MTSFLILGFLLGMRHAIEADHVAAVATLVRENRSLRQSMRHGAIWGLGHTITLFLFGSAVIIFGGSVSQELASWLEFSVGLLLLLLGLDVIRRVYRDRIHFHSHEHSNKVTHFHAHSHNKEVKHDNSAHQHQHNESFPKRALLVGFMHGMAGASALILLTLNQFDSPLNAMIYIALFGLGSIAGMAVLSVIIAWPMRYSASGMTRLHNGLHYSLGLVTVLLGIKIMIVNV